MRELVRTIIGLSAVAVCAAAFLAYQIIAYGFAQQRCDAEGDVCYGIQIQMVADIFKEKYSRYPTPAEFADLLNLTFASATIVTNRGGPARWCYDEKSGEISLNTSGKYRTGPCTVMDLSETRFRRPTMVREIHFDRTEPMDYSWANTRFDKEIPEIFEVITNWYMTNRYVMATEGIKH